MAALTLLAIAGPAGATQYVYDANGRLAVVTDDSGESARYVYDAMGNILRVERVQASELRLFTLVPAHGTAETPVTLRGQGFSSQVAGNTVLFNGTAATVTSATANEIRTTVPFGATTGPVTLAVGGRQVVSDAPFTVDDTGLPPTVGDVTPVTAAAGDTLSVTGTHLYPIPGKTSLRLGTRSLDIAQAATNSALAAILPKSASSGRVSVQTPYGTADGTQTVLVVPLGIAPGQIASRGVATMDSSHVSLQMPGAGKIGALLFDNDGRDWVTLQLSDVVTNNSQVTYQVYAPGNTLVQQGYLDPSQLSLHLARLSGSGTYLVLFTPQGAPASFTVGVESNRSITGQPTTLSVHGASQSVRGTFVAEQGQTLVVKIDPALTTPAGANVGYEVRSPSGIAYTWNNFPGAGGLNIPSVPQSGTWQLIAWPGAGYTGNMQVAVVKVATGSLSASGPAQHFDAVASKQNVYFDFDAEPLASYELAFQGATLIGSGYTQYQVYVTGPGGQQIASPMCYTNSANGNCALHLWYLTGGHYQVTVVPVYDGELHFDAILRKHIGGRALPVDGELAFNLPAAQAERVTFEAAAGQTVALHIADMVMQPAAAGVRVLVYRPDAGAITTQTVAYADVSISPAGTINLPALPVSGNYTVIVLPDLGAAGTFRLQLFAGAVTPLIADGDAGHIATRTDRQTGYLDFDIAPNAMNELVIDNLTTAGAAYPQVYVNIYDSVGRNVASGYCYQPACEYHLWRLPKGHYRAVIDPNYGGTFTLDARLRTHVTGRSFAKDTPLAFALATGVAEEIGFNGTAGDTVALQVSNIVSAGGQGVRFILYSPDTGAITAATRAYTDFVSTSSGLVNLPSLPATGRYTLMILPVNGTAASGVASILSGEAGAIDGSGDGTTFDTNAPTQSAYLNFTAGPNEDLELTLADVAVNGAQYPQFYVEIRDQAGRYILGDSCVTANVGASCQYHLWRLPPGRYNVTVSANYGGTLHFNAMVRRRATGPVLARDTPTVVSLAQGQPMELTFPADAGDGIALKFEGTTTTPAGGSVRVLVYRPDAGAIVQSTRAYTDFTVSQGGVVDLVDLPVAGMYRVLLLPSYGLPATSTITSVSGGRKAIPVDGGAVRFDSTANGQAAYGEFTTTRLQDLELTLSSATTTGAQYPQFYVYVWNSTGRQVAGDSCVTSNTGNSCEFHLWALPPGRYRFTATPNYGGTVHFDARVQSHLTTALAPGVSTPLSTGAGQARRFTVSANAGDTLTLQLTDIVTNPAGAPVRFLVYRPDVGLITNNTRSLADAQVNASQVMSVANLPVAGAYTVIALPGYGLAASGHVKATLSAGTDEPHHQPTNLPMDAAKHAFSSGSAASDLTLTFDAHAGDNLEIAFTDALRDGGKAGSFYVQVYDPAGTNIDNYTCWPVDPACARSFWNLVEGTYAVVVRSGGSSLALQATGRPNTVVGALTPGVPADITRGLGEALRYTFRAEAGETAILHLDNLASTPAGYYTNVLVYRPDGGAIWESNPYSSFYSRDRTTLTLPNLPVAGEYVVIVGGDVGLPQTGTLTLFKGQADPNVSVAHPNRFDASTSAQNLYLKVDTGTGGDFEFSLYNGVTTASTYYSIAVFDPDGVNVDNYACYLSSPACTREWWNTRAGIYTVVVQPDGLAKIGFDAVLKRNVDRGTLQIGTPVDISHGFADVLRLKFSASQGQTLALRLDGVTSSPAGYNTTVMVFRPDGGLVWTNNSYSSMYSKNLHILNLPDLPVTGDYLVTVGSDYGLAGGGTLTLVAGVAGDGITDGVTKHFQANTNGQSIYLDADTGNGGDFELVMTNKSNDGGRASYYYVSVFDPSGVNVDNYYCYFSDPACTHDFWNAKAGKYRLVAQAQEDDKIRFDATIQRNPDLGPMTVGQPKDFTHGLGDVVRTRFHGEIGQAVALRLSDLGSTPAGYNVTVSVYRPDTGLIWVQNPYARYYSRDALTLNLGDLPVTGDYEVVIGSDYAMPAHGSLTVVPGVTGATVSEASAQHLKNLTPSQTVSMNVDTGAGGNFEFILENVSIVGSSYFTLAVYDPDGRNVDNFYCYASDPACIRDWWNALGGIYTVVVTPDREAMVGFDASLTRNVELGALAYDEPKELAHQRMVVERTSFDAQLGDTVTLTFDDIVTDTAGRNATISVYRPDVGLVWLQNPFARVNTSTATSLTLPNLPVGGRYIVVIGTDWGVPAHGHLSVKNGI
ncbi:YD repeat-containing protein [Luteibacter sp. 621]|uniref:RHS repeat domain-containing protein n=1 Tax=Luteibacter sp. 621 TaxID=3373916 RepID=UPI003D1E7584